MLAFIVTAVASSAPRAQAAQTFPAGCSSAIGYSITNGAPCNGTSNASFLIAGCMNVLGFSTVNGAPCSGSSEALLYLNGCSSTYGYSTITSTPCNGSALATFYVDPNTTPGLPTTGATPTSVTLLVLSGILAIGGIVYATRTLKRA